MLRLLVYLLSSLLLPFLLQAERVLQFHHAKLNDRHFETYIDVDRDGISDLLFVQYESGVYRVYGRSSKTQKIHIACEPRSDLFQKIAAAKAFYLSSNWSARAILSDNGLKHISGKGNCYLAGRMLSEKKGCHYFWVLLNLSADEKELCVVKSAFETQNYMPVITGLETGYQSLNYKLNSLQSPSQNSEVYGIPFRIMPMNTKRYVAVTDVHIGFHWFVFFQNLNAQVGNKSNRKTDVQVRLDGFIILC